MEKINNTLERELKQWLIWPPALAVLIVWTIGMWLLRSMMPADAILVAYVIVGVGLVWWLLPRLACKIWHAGDALHWRWGQLHNGVNGKLPLVEIVSVEVLPLPDKPTQPIRRLNRIEIHGGNFTPALNRGVKISCRDGRTIWFGLPQPDKFATALRAALPRTDETA